MRNAKVTEYVSIADGTIVPSSQAAGASNGGWVKADAFERYMAVVSLGTLGASATVDAKLQQATSSGGAGAKDVTGTSITQFTKAGSDDNKQALINLNPTQDMDINGGFYWFRLVITVGTAASLTCGSVYGVGSRNDLAANVDATTVAQIVN